MGFVRRGLAKGSILTKKKYVASGQDPAILDALCLA